MRNVWTIASREFKLFFVSPIAYAVAFFFILFLGIIFYLSLRVAILQAAYQPFAPSVQIITGPMVTLLIFVMPAITMRSIAEEIKTGTMELLLTAPVKDWELVVGKWLGAYLFMLLLLAVTFIFPIVLNFLVVPGIDQGLFIAGYLGLALMIASLIAIGIFISSLFTNQIVAFVVSLLVVLILLFTTQFSTSAGGLGNQLLTYLGYGNHIFNTFLRGTIDLSDIAYFLSLTALALFFGTVSIEYRRWR